MWEVFIHTQKRQEAAGSRVYPRDFYGMRDAALRKAPQGSAKLRGRRSEKEGAHHLFSPPCSEQKRDDLCGAGAAAPRRGRILAFSSAASRVARVAECAVVCLRFLLVSFI